MTSPERPLHLLSAGLEARARTFLGCGLLARADLLVVDAVAPRYREEDPDVLLGLAFAVRAPRAGHVGVDLRSMQDLFDDEGVRSVSGSPDEAAPSVDWPASAVLWEQQVLASPLVGRPADRDRPFVHHACAGGPTLVMTRRMWREQERLAEGLRALADSPPARSFGDDAVERCIARLFEDVQSEPARAVRAVVRRRLTVTTGGPGSGKTYSVKRLVALMLELTANDAEPLVVALAAPTGKAAVRMKEAIEENIDDLAVSDRVRAAMRALEPQTLHRLLGIRQDGSVRRDRAEPLAADLVIVDEASMVDLVLMRRLVDAVPPGARLVLLGDRDQLASVEVGSVLADLVGGASGPAAGPREDALARSMIRFRGSHRFESAKTVAEVARLLQDRGPGDVERAWRLFTGEARVDDPLPDRIVHLDARLPGAARGSDRPTEAQLDALAAPYLAAGGYVGRIAAVLRDHGEDGAALRSAALHDGLLDALEGYRVLAVHRRGPRGVTEIDRAIAARARKALEAALQARRGSPASPPVRLPAIRGRFLGEIVLVTENAYDVGLMNGDTGLVLPTAFGLAAVFRDYDRGEKGCRAVDLARLPAHAGAFAMTVHKSQGSQFGRVALVLAGRGSPIETRELVYTAVTRARSRLDWLGDAGDLRRALERPIRRASGLRDLLWG